MKDDLARRLAGRGRATDRLGKHWPWLVLFFLLWALHLTTVSDVIGGSLGGDNIVYYLLGQALAAGQGYVDLYLPGHPVHNQYPFLFPLLLAPFHWLFAKPLPAMHVMVSFLNVLGAVAAGRLAARRLNSNLTGMALALIFGTLPQIYLTSGHLLSEPVYMAFCYLALLLVEANPPGEIKGSRLALLILVALAAYFTRTAGFALVLALAFALWRSRRNFSAGARRLPAALALLLVWGVLAAAWAWRDRLASSADSAYLSSFMFYQDPYRLDLGMVSPLELLTRINRNTNYYMIVLGPFNFAPKLLWQSSDLVTRIVGLVLAALMGIGLVQSLRKTNDAAEIYFLLTLGTAMIWPYSEDRFVLPIRFLAFFYLCFGAMGVLERFLAPRAAQRALLIGLALCMVAQAYLLSGLVRRRFVDGREPKKPIPVIGYGLWTEPVINWAKFDTDYLDASPKTRETISRDTEYYVINRVAQKLELGAAVFMSRKPTVTYIMSGHEAVPLLTDPRPERQWSYIQNNRVDYIITGLNEGILQDSYRQWPERFTVIAQIQGSQASIVRVNRPAGGASGPRPSPGPGKPAP